MVADSSVRILHVDDDVAFADMAAEFLEREDDRFTVETASSVVDGVARLSETDFDCVVSDFDMPAETGLEFLETVRRESPDLPFILFTGKGSEAIASDAISAGVTDYLQKGTDTSQYAVLANRIRNAVGRYDAQAQIADREKRLRLFFDQSPMGVIEWDPSMCLVRLNESASTILGYEHQDVVGEPYDAFLPPCDRELAADVRATLLDTGGGCHNVTEVVRKDGERIVCEWHSGVIRDEGGDVTAIFSQFADITERRDREQRLEESRARLEALFENSPNMINVHDAAGNIIEPNQAMCEYTGYERATLVDMKVWDIDRAIDAESARALWAEMAVGERREVEGEFERRDGSTFPVEVHIRRLRLDGEPRFMVISRDISQRKERERELRMRSTAMEASIDGMAILEDGEYVFVNQAHADIYGYDGPDALLGETWRTCYNEAQLERFETEIMPIVSAEGSWRGEATATRNDGSTFRQELSLTTISDGGLICVVRDITARKRQEDALSALHEATQAFMEAPDKQSIAETALETARETLDLPLGCMWLFDPETEALRPIAVTAEAEDLFGEPPAYTAGDSLSWQAFEANSLRVYDDLLDEPDRLNPETSIRSELIVPLGEHGVMNFGATAPADFTAIDRSLARILGKTVQAALSRADREAQLRTQSRTLRRQNERLEKFTSVVSHDLRNPLTVASGRVEVAREGSSDPNLDAAMDALERMETLIDDLLTLAREGDRVTETESLSLDAMVRGCWENVETGDATLRSKTGRTIRADKNRLKQLLENLIANAIEHGGPGVTVTVGDLDDGFYVADDGPGIPEADREQVLEPGYSTTENGTGFGLRIVHEIAETHGWEIRVRHSAADGARIEVGNVETAVTE